ncbi:deoxynucleoside kinase [Candidatus Falkowbacteria bacterium]|jgi:deoxyadenosine/deoxycytidine kinase|nr:deoxynucleoside kinase [Candidatus Falkowbacteria bacterium]MBT5503220.1 deoxynucleoside kinase [Candidatus Falkowbacteria bacterium]MBT6573873.1 deoxynucleoside kinase [Candidatus Falkowbacteria bacterium]MBT7348520.1 deoxynucleoside kinase [Candidatus Falkowbacteria bacterium]MBT7500815.1 deoxynucleoside kinase [Candidatus Falkowbacteria bacterium]
MKNKKFIAISGNIGIGKSTLTKKLAGHFKLKPYIEPVTENPYLEDFYKDMKKWAYHSQMFFLGKRLQDHYDLTVDKHSVIQDRSIYENAEVFARHLYNRKHISKRDWKSYRQIYKVCTKILPAPDLVIYLRASVDRIMQRIEKRGRDFEKTIDRKYIKDLNDLYDNWAGNFKLAQVIIINYDDLDFKNRAIDFDNFLEVLKEYL